MENADNDEDDLGWWWWLRWPCMIFHQLSTGNQSSLSAGACRWPYSNSFAGLAPGQPLLQPPFVTPPWRLSHATHGPPTAVGNTRSTWACAKLKRRKMSSAANAKRERKSGKMCVWVGEKQGENGKTIVEQTERKDTRRSYFNEH